MRIDWYFRLFDRIARILAPIHPPWPHVYISLDFSITLCSMLFFNTIFIFYAFCQNFYYFLLSHCCDSFFDYLVNLIIDLRACICRLIISRILRSETRINLIWQVIGRFQLNKLLSGEVSSNYIFGFWMGFRTSRHCPSTLDRSITIFLFVCFSSLFYEIWITVSFCHWHFWFNHAHNFLLFPFCFRRMNGLF